MTKIVINRCYGGYNLSHEAKLWLSARGLMKPMVEYTVPWGYVDAAIEGDVVDADWRGVNGEEPNVYKYFEEVGGPIPRHHPVLVECVETLGEAANGNFANLQVFTIEGTKYLVDEYDGAESVLTPEAMEWIDAAE